MTDFEIKEFLNEVFKHAKALRDTPIPSTTDKLNNPLSVVKEEDFVSETPIAYDVDQDSDDTMDVDYDEPLEESDDIPATIETTAEEVASVDKEENIQEEERAPEEPAIEDAIEAHQESDDTAEAIDATPTEEPATEVIDEPAIIPEVAEEQAELADSQEEVEEISSEEVEAEADAESADAVAEEPVISAEEDTTSEAAIEPVEEVVVDADPLPIEEVATLEEAPEEAADELDEVDKVLQDYPQEEVIAAPAIEEQAEELVEPTLEEEQPTGLFSKIFGKKRTK